MTRSRGRPALLVACGLTACDASLTVGYNDAGSSVSPASCPTSALLRGCGGDPCVVTELSPAQIGRETLAVDGEFIYFLSSADRLGKIPKGGGAVTELTAVPTNLERIILDDENVYFTVFDGDVFEVPKAGGTPRLVTAIFGHPISIASHEGDLYVAMTDSGEVAKIEKSTGATTTLAGQNAPVDLARDDRHVYWVNQGQPGAANGELVRAPLGDLTAAEVLSSNLEEPLALGVTSEAILWATYDKVFRLARAGGEPQAFDVPFGEAKGVTEFEGIAYAVGESGFFRVPLAGGAASALDRRGFTGLTLGCDGLYAVGWFEPVLVRYGR